MEDNILYVIYMFEETYNIGFHFNVYCLYNEYKHIDSKIFLDLLEYYNSISSFQIGEKEIGYRSVKKIIENSILNNHMKMITTIDNLIYCFDLLAKDTEPTLKLLDNLLRYSEDYSGNTYYDRVIDLLLERNEVFIQ